MNDRNQPAGSEIDTPGAVTVMSVLGHELRIEIWRKLLVCGPQGLSSGAMSVQLVIPPSSLSYHLQQMVKAGVLVTRQASRHTIYSVNKDTVEELCVYLRTAISLILPASDGSAVVLPTTVAGEIATA